MVFKKGKLSNIKLLSFFLFIAWQLKGGKLSGITNPLIFYNDCKSRPAGGGIPNPSQLGTGGIMHYVW